MTISNDSPIKEMTMKKISTDSGISKQMIQYATLGAVFQIIFGLFASLGGFLKGSIVSWQDYVLLVTPIIVFVLGLTGLVLLRREKPIQGASLVFIANLILPIVAILLQTGLGWAVFVYALTSSIMLIWRAMPNVTRRWTFILAALTLVLIAAMEWFNPSVRVAAGAELSTFFYIASVIMTALFYAQSSHEFWTTGNIETKIVLWAGTGFFISAALIIGYAAFTLRNQVSRSAEETAQKIAREKAADIRTVLERTLGAAETFTQSVSVVKTEGVQLSRAQVNAMLRQMLKENPQFVGVDVLWEPNAFDRMDAEFANTEGSDANGRFVPYWTRGPGGEIQVELLQDYDISDWYQCPKTTKVTCLIDPYIYPVQGQDVWMTSVVVPFVVDGTFYGITGVDTPVTFLQEIADDVNIFDGKGYVAIFSNNGTILGMTGQPELIGQTATVIHDHFSAEDYLTIKNGEEKLQYADDGMLEAYAPIRVGETVSPWSVNVIVPREIILADATRQMWNMIGIGGSLLVLSLVALFYAARQIAQPIRKLTETAQVVAGGNLDVTADVKSKDETGVLATAFNQMTSQLRDLVGSLEQRVADRTKALATVAEVGTAIATILETDRLLQEVVDLTKERFSLYHSHIYLLDETGENLVLATGAGQIGRAMVAEGRSIPLSREQSLVARAARDRKGVTVNDVAQEIGFLPHPLLPDTHAELAVPMIVGEKVIGVFDIQSEQVGRFSEADIAVQTTLASQVATSIQNVRQFEQSKKRADLESLVNVIGQKIQRTTSIEETLQIAARELGLALGAQNVKVMVGQSVSRNLDADNVEVNQALVK